MMLFLGHAVGQAFSAWIAMCRLYFVLSYINQHERLGVQ